jgi:hypothetical protein
VIAHCPCVLSAPAGRDDADGHLSVLLRLDTRITSSSSPSRWCPAGGWGGSRARTAERTLSVASAS